MPASAKPRLLVVSSRSIPSPLSAGYAIRTFNTAKALSEQFELDLLTLGTERCQQVDVAMFEGIFRKVIHFPFPTGRYLANAAGGLFAAQPLQVSAFTFPAVRRWIHAHQRDYQGVLANHVRVAELVKGLEVPVAVDLVDAISLNYHRAMAKSQGLWRLAYGLEKDRLLRYEVQTINHFPRSYVVSDLDRRYLISHGADPERLAAVPVGVHDHVIRRAPYRGPEEDSVVFLGKMNYHPNQDAAIFFAREVLPRLRAQVGDLKFYVVGGSPTREVQALSELPGVVVTGFVEDPYVYLERAKAVVAPIRFGAGIQNKILEGMALRKAVVTTSVGAGGIGGSDGRELLVADSAQDAANAILRCLEDASLRRELGIQARRLIERQFTWPSIGMQLRESMRSMLGLRMIEGWA